MEGLLSLPFSEAFAFSLPTLSRLQKPILLCVVMVAVAGILLSACCSRHAAVGMLQSVSLFSACHRGT